MDQETNQTESLAVNNRAQQSTADKWDISDEPLDDDAVELDVDGTFIASVVSEREWIPLSIRKRISSATNGCPPVTPPIETDACLEDHTASLTVGKSLSPQDAENLSLSEELSGHDLLALDADNSEPLPFEDICPIVVEFVAQQLNEFDWSKLKRRICMEQLKYDSRTFHWVQDVRHEKFAC
ncbi:uncharacterized protein M421DRAFT_424566 [Didymella exigua CBS 183.55]|uniref:Uncharacterized protein n=1 Tax=Didymella exigua CBS 183.55 TaxID=1150837 RepID=A0A6A5RBM5_9PLEO|nr:uncharacterized protein M421DRAFT_424566 [Didymella exigua CBS 183.55]KAF1924680.1 hypothetical protein M421DRAFT_424566 [Didymella exigua CBS 183.55]